VKADGRVAALVADALSGAQFKRYVTFWINAVDEMCRLTPGAR